MGCARAHRLPDLAALSREEFRRLQRGGREWIVRGPAYLDPGGGEYRVVLVSGAQVLIERERFGDGYVRLAAS